MKSTALSQSGFFRLNALDTHQVTVVEFEPEGGEDEEAYAQVRSSSLLLSSLELSNTNV